MLEMIVKFLKCCLFMAALVVICLLINFIWQFWWGQVIILVGLWLIFTLIWTGISNWQDQNKKDWQQEVYDKWEKEKEWHKLDYDVKRREVQSLLKGIPLEELEDTPYGIEYGRDGLPYGDAGDEHWGTVYVSMDYGVYHTSEDCKYAWGKEPMHLAKAIDYGFGIPCPECAKGYPSAKPAWYRRHELLKDLIEWYDLKEELEEK